MPKLAGSIRTFALSWGNCSLCYLLAAIVLAAGAAGVTLWAQTDIAATRARAEAGDPEALNTLGSAYANGQGVPQDLAQALRLYQRAADRGLGPAFFNLGMMHELGRGVPADPANAFKHYLKAAELGLAPAQFNVGNMYSNGIGVAPDLFEAALWFRQAADRGIPEAQYNLAMAYELGRGVGKDEAAAQRWYRESAGQGYTRAQYNLALMLEEGRGSAIDLATAAELYRAAAVQNYAPAQNNLGILYAEGRGVAANLVDAYMWLALAVENGARTAGRDLVAQQLSSAQLADANIGVAKLRAQLGPRDAAQAAAGGGTPGSVIAAAALAADRPAAPAATAGTEARPGGTPPEVERLRADNARLAAENAQLKSAPAASARSKKADAARASELATLNSRLTTAQSDAEKLRAENARLTKASQAAQRDKSALEQQLAAAQAVKASTPAETAALNTLRAQVAQLTRENAEAQRQAEALTTQLRAARESGAAGSATLGPGATSALTMPQLSAIDPRIARLAADNARMNDDVKRSTIELGQLGRQLRTAQDRIGALEKNGASASTGGGDEARWAELTRQLDDMRASNAKITAENQRLSQAVPNPAETAKGAEKLAAAQAELGRLQAENERLGRAATAAAGAAPAAQQRAARAEKSLAEITRERDALAKEKTALERRVAENASRPATDPEQVRKLRTQLATAEKATTEARTERDRLAAQAGELQRAGQSLAAERGTMEQLRTQLADAQGKLSAAQRGQAAGTEAIQRLSELTARIAVVTAERDGLAAARGAGSADRDTNRKLNAQLEGAGRSIAELNALNENLKKDLEVSQQSTAAALAAQAAAARAGPSDALKLELQTLQNQVRLVETQMEEDRKNASREIASLASQLQSARESSRALSEANRTLLQIRGSEEAAVKGEVDQLAGRLRATQADLEKMRAETEKARADHATLIAKYSDAEKASQQHGASVAELTGQLAIAQRDLAAARAETARLNEAVQSVERDRNVRLAQLHAENSAISARLRQAQGTLDQIASAARLINGGGALSGTIAPTAPATTAPTVPITAGSTAAEPARSHVVAEGDSLTRISSRYYGTAARWQDIYDANRDVLGGENALRPGLKLRIP